MPFVPPPTYASKATTGYLATFALSTTVSPPTFVPVVEVKSIQPTLIDVPQVGTSHLQSINNTEEFIPGMIKPGTVKITGQLIGDPTHLQFLTLAQSQAFIAWEITANMQRNLKTYVCSGTGYIAKYDPGPFENNRPIEFSMDLQISGSISEVVT